MENKRQEESQEETRRTGSTKCHCDHCTWKGVYAETLSGNNGPVCPECQHDI